MREFTFTVVYDRGVDPLMDVFLETPALTAVSFDGCVLGDRFWRLERFTGPPEALDRVERVRRDEDYDDEGVTETPVEAVRYHETVERDGDRLLLYSYVSDIHGGDSVHSIAGRILDEGALFETRRHEGRHEWRVLLRTDRNVGQLYDTLTGRLRDGLAFETGHLREVDGWNPALLNEPSLPGEQRVALRTAWELGYYETPSDASLDDIAEELGVPRSTLSYRLRRAEAQLVRDHFEGPG
ncbi:helix-turn-helix domain-containing protein [Salinirubellus salinus]|jgi:predicted DNA binding protein|uniref:Helix-turn-helix domain-containing protein n=1 Tax=Salinirubellus salinus TaxID=1364945 RepID=A0A9E7R1G3_9EURY|nr:helix-turn-helix domain-containing protein [Salinirubellus salinus]UWM53514.1 helix-turn-helix domain-containing protein [Salinirubellus salinus]